MKIVFTTENYLFQMDLLNDKEPVVIAEEGPHHNFWGITWDNQGYLYNVRTTSPENHFIEVRDWDDLKKVTRVLQNPKFNFCHQILYVDVLNTLFVANTHDAEVLCFKDSRLVDIIDLKKVDSAIPLKHTNSLHYSRGFLYIGNHNKGASCVVIYNVLTKEIGVTRYFGEHTHNVWYENKALSVCSSKNAEILSYHAGRVYSLYKGSGFLRGVARSKNHLIVGETVFRPTESNPDPFPAHTEKQLEFAEISVIDCTNYQRVYSHSLEKFEARQIFDIRLLDEVDFAHKESLL